MVLFLLMVKWRVVKAVLEARMKRLLGLPEDVDEETMHKSHCCYILNWNSEKSNDTAAVDRLHQTIKFIVYDFSSVMKGIISDVAATKDIFDNIAGFATSYSKIITPI